MLRWRLVIQAASIPPFHHRLIGVGVFIITDRHVKPCGEFGTLTLHGGRFAAFMLQGSYKGFYGLYNAIYNNWLQQSGEQLRDAMPFELYLNNPTHTREEDLLTEIFIPIA